MTEALQPSLSSYLSLRLPPLPLEGVFLFPPEPPPAVPGVPGPRGAVGTHWYCACRDPKWM